MNFFGRNPQMDDILKRKTTIKNFKQKTALKEEDSKQKKTSW